MLSILRSLVQEVNSARDLQEALDVIVSRVQKAMDTEVCSVYLLDPATNRYILMATEGLYQQAVGQVSLAYSEGLIGLVGSREEPINLEDAPSHPAIVTFLRLAKSVSARSWVFLSFTIAGFLVFLLFSNGKVRAALTRVKKPSWLPFRLNWPALSPTARQRAPSAVFP